MDRKEITETLTQLAERYITEHNGFSAREVEAYTDYRTCDIRRLDLLSYYRINESIAGIESGKFVCYEIKSCKADFNSGFGRNDIADENYFVMTAQTYLDVKEELANENFSKFGVYVPIPRQFDANCTRHNVQDWLMNPTPFTNNIEDWKLCKILNCYYPHRTKAAIEMMYMILKAKCRGR